ncbi:MAG: hypothetical protein DRO94_00805 [Candidatus Altiarchaeales archaeon]|nr:MAG: hypothetical protein DRO95_01830 [Candidatus Altiarchaeales archaeon]RLI95284.1 MAG: hypothetical protein DRO94_00805 [Candidatus Altiarchaeales archaeon]HDO82470.1 DNA double-strand break repair nuclease NurA [Candidatus Altiarchaeales archaeon]HEX55119.1 DNA double-strand break repair nuclease NurA [Candidatus Altiarchaeales archaeon]
MSHYSIWLKRYLSCREKILKDLERYKGEIEKVKDKIIDKNLILPLGDSRNNISGRMCFVDGGEGIRELLGAAVYFIKASALLIDKKGNRKNGEKFVRDLDIGIIDYDEHTKERVELLRSGMEFDIALECVEEYDPDYIFLDGSLYVNSRKKPIECKEYSIYRKKFVRLLKVCKKNLIHIAGISEDSKSKLFINYLSLKYDINFPRFMTDSSVLRMIYGNRRYRTIEFTPQSRFETDYKLSETMVASFPTVYVQPTPLSNPLRIDIPDWDRGLEEIINIVVELSKGSRNYGYPLPMYLVHLDAKVNKRQADWSTKQLIHHLSRNDPSFYSTILHDTRHNLRPEY